MIKIYRLKLIFLLLILVLSKVTLAQSTYYWVGGSGWWEDGQHWSLSSGGTVVAGVYPGSSNLNDNAIFNNNSFTAINQTVSVGLPNIFCHDMTWTNIPNGTTFIVGSNITLSGSLIYAPNMVLQNTSGNTTFISGSAEIINTGGIQNIIKNLTFNGNGTWTLQNFLNVDNDITFDKGTLVSDNYGLMCSKFISTPANLFNYRVLNIGNSLFTIKLPNNPPYLSWNVNNTMHTFHMITAGNSLIKFIGTSGLSTMHAGENLFYDNVEFMGNGRLEILRDTMHDLAFHGNGEIIGDSSIIHDAVFDHYALINGNHNNFHDVTIGEDGDIGTFSLSGRNVDYNTFHIVEIGLTGRVYGNHNNFYDLLFTTKRPSCWLETCHYCPGTPDGELHGNHDSVSNNLVFYREGKMFGTMNYINDVAFWCDSWVLQGSNTFLTINLHRYFEECYYYIPNTNYTTPSHVNVLTFQSDSIQHLLGNFNLLGQILCHHTIIQSTSNTVAAFFQSDSVLTLDYIELRHISSSNPQNISDTAIRSIDGGGNYFWDFSNIYVAVQSGNSSSTPAFPCWYDNNGTITLSPIGGIPPYQYSILLYNPGTGYPYWSPYQTDSVFSPLYPNTYQINILDSYHCLFINSVVVSSPPIISMVDTVIQDLSCFGFNDGSIQILAIGGTPPLNYSINGGSYNSSNTFTNLAPGIYNITIKDNLGCTRLFGPFTIEEPPLLTLGTGGANIVIQCPGDSTATITALAAGGTPPYQYTFAGPYNSPYVTQNYPTTSSNILGNIHAGVWYVTVTDHNGCEATDITQRTEPQPITISIDITSTNNCADTTHFKATASVGGGTAPYINYTWYTSLGLMLGSGPSNVSPFLIPGAYRVIVKDLHNCADTTDFSISILTSKVDTVIDKLCNGGANTGYACVSGLGGSGLFGYHWSNNWNFSCLMNVDTGYYYVTVTDTKYGCKVYDSIYINQPDTGLSMLAFSDSTTCQGLQDGTAWVIAHGGTGPYTYHWSGNQTNDTITQLWPGVYTVTVTDSHGCKVSGSTTLFSPPTGIVSFDTGWNCTPQGYWVQALVTGGTPPFSYAWDPVPGNSSIITGYPGILQHVLVTDANNCPYEGSVIVVEHEVNLSVHNAQCFGDNSGYATAHPTGGNLPPYTYKWFVAGNLTVISTNDTALNLIAGNYLLVLTDSHGCIDSVAFTITQPSAPVVISMGAQSSGNVCSYHCNGIALASPNGGTPPYTYHWSPGNQTTSFISNLCSGTYKVTVTDSHACLMVGTSVITAPPAIVVDSIHIDSLRCNVPDSTGKAIIFAHGGTGNLTYRVDGGVYQSSTLFTGLAQGIHNFTVKDASNCTFDIPATIPAPPLLGLTLTTTPTSGFGLCDGAAQSLVSGGIQPYNYAWSNGQTTQNINNLCQGIYCLTITDAHGCPKNNCIILSSPGQIVFTTNSQNIKCHDSLTGSIQGSVAGGIPPYTFTWNPGLPFTPQPVVTATAINWNNLPAGIYSITVTDANAISKNQSFILTQPSQFQLNINHTDSICTGTIPAQGWAMATISGNTPPYTYTWYGGSGANNTTLYDSLTIGTYTLQVRDINLCKISRSVTVHPYTDPVAVFSIDSVCKGTATILRDSSYATGTSLANAYLQWGDGQFVAFNYPPNPPQNIPHLYQNPSAYSYPYLIKLIVKDNHGCYSDTTLHPATVLPIPTSKFSYDTACFGNNTTMIDLSNDNGSPIVYRSWRIVTQTVPYQVVEQHIFPNLNINLNPVTLIVSNAFCADSVTHLIPIDSLPFPAFSSKDSICIPGMVRFSDLSVPNGSALAGWFWKFGDGYSAANSNPIHTYLQTNNTYQVQLTVSSARGCSDSIQHSVYVNPERLFTLTASPVCFGDATQFTGLISPTNENWVTQYWTFGDGQTSFAINPSHVYGAPGIYTVVLIGTDAEGCENFAFNPNVVVNPLPVADFTDTVFCDQSPVKFYNTSVSNAPGTSTFIWNFGGAPVTTTSTYLTHTFPAPGSYAVTLIVINSNDCSDTITKIITIEPLPSADFKSDTTCFGTSTQFTDLSTPFPGHWIWNFGDPGSGVSNTETLQNPSHLFSASGTYSVKLKIITNNGCLDSITKTVIVQNNPIAAFATDPLTHCLRDTLHFINQSTLQPNSSPSSWSWNFGNPASGFSNTSSAQNPGHHFTQAGQYNVSLIVSSIPGNGCSDTVSHIVTINPHPIADFTSSISCQGDSSFVWDASQSINGTLTSSYWNFGTPPNSFTFNSAHIFTGSGTYTVIHAVSNSDLCSDTVIKNIQVLPLPQAAFSHSTLCLNNLVHFTDISNPVFGTVSAWNWNFGDPLSNFNNTSTLQNPAHTYLTTGTYIVRLAIITLAGCRDTIYDTLVIMPTPIASFSATDTCMGLPMQFTSLSTSALGNIVTWNWDFGNATTGNAQNPVVTYPISGTYMVTLTVIDQAQCISSVVAPVHVHSLPSPSFTAAITCSGNPVAFTDYTNGGGFPIISRLWNFGDPANPPNTASAQDTFHLYPNPGLYAVTLTVTNSKSCTNTSVENIFVPPGVTADFTFPNNVCHAVGSSIQFLDQSIAVGTIVSNWYWDFNDGIISTLQNPLHAFLATGTFQVSLTVTTLDHCTQTITKTIVISNLPNVAISFQPGTVCLGDTAFFTGFASGSNMPVINWFWDFSDPPVTSTLQNPAHVFSNPGSYQVQLIIEDSQHCVNSYLSTVSVYPKPVANYTFTYPACEHDSACFTDNTNYNGSFPYQWYWNFGDPMSLGLNTSTLPNTCHYFVSPVSHTVALTVVNTYGCSDSVSQNLLYQTGLGPVCQYSVNNGTLCFGDSTAFVNQSVATGAPLTAYYWNFGDFGIDNISTAISPKHLFTAPGTYTVTLMITDNHGCSSITSQQLVVKTKPLADFDFNLPICLNTLTSFTENSATAGVPITNWVWEINSIQSTVNGAVLQQSFINPGLYSIKLTVTNQDACQSSIVKTLQINPKPKAIFGFSPNNILCEGKTVTFTETSTPGAGSLLVHSWNFGDSPVWISGTGGVVTHSYVNTSNSNLTFQVSLAVENSEGCRDTMVQTLVVEPEITVGFQSDTACAGTVTHFSDLSFPGPVQWQWNFGDPASGSGNSAVLQNPSHQFSSAGTYSVKLKITTSNGCQDSVVKTVVVLAPAVPEFAIDQMTHCVNDTMEFINLTVLQPNSTVNSWSWNFGNSASGSANISSLQNPGHHFTQAGQFNINLTVTTLPGNGCTATITHQVSVKPQPIADFTSSPGCMGYTTYVLDSSQAINGSIINSYWNFGTAPYSYGLNAAYIFAATGSYPVIHAVTNSDFCTDTIIKNITVLGLPQAAFSYSKLCVNNAVHFTDLTNAVNGTVSEWSWNFGDPLSNNNNFSTLKNPDHTFASTGTYTVQLAILTSTGCRDTVVQTITVMPNPVANFSATDTCMGSPVQFTDLSTSAQGAIVSWSWNFGNGNGGNTQYPVATYTAAGTFNVTLAVSNQAQCTNSITLPVHIHSLPNTSFIATVTCSGNPVAFTDYSNGSGFPITSWAWNFGDPANPPNTASAQDTFHLYQNSGLYSVSLTVTNSKSCKNTSVQNVFVPPGITADFSIGTNACQAVGNSIQFIDQSVTTSSNISNWYWDFNDGTVSTLQNPVHIFLATGTFQVSLTVTTLDHCIKTITKPVVIDNLPTVVFSYQPGNLCLGETAHFTGFASGNNMPVINWFWDFGDPPANSLLQNPDHTFGAQGSYQVHLIIEDSHHCINSYASSISVYPAPSANFSISYPVCEHDSACFTDISAYNNSFPYQWFWNFGDPLSTNLNISNLPNPCHYFISPVTHNVSLTVVNTYGCSDTTSQNVAYQTGQGPNCQFTLNSGTLCFGDSTTFINQSTGAGAPITAYHWSFGDFGPGNISTKANPRHLFTAAGTYTVILTITDSHGCTNSSTQQVVIKTTPLANFTFNTPVCLNMPATFTENSLTAGVPILTRVWKIDNITLGTNAQVIQQAFSNPGLHTIQLTVTNQSGCDSTVTKTLLINPKPQALFSYSPNTIVCDGVTVNFTENSSAGAGSIVTRSWNFGDATTWNTSPGSFITHIYTNTTTAPISYQVKLAIENSEGCRDTIMHTILIRPRPVPAFTFSAVSCLHDTIHFSGSSSTPNGSAIINWNWVFGDAGSMFPTGTGQTITHVFSALSPSPWNYTITLNVFDGYCPNTVNQQLTVNPLPVADFTYDPACLGNPTQFHNNSSSVNGQITNWQWSFGSTLANPQHTFLTAGFSSVTLTVTDVFSCKKTVQKQVEVFPLPVVAFSYHDTCTPGINGGQVHFHDLSQPTSSAIVSWHWQMNAGTSSSLQNPVQSFYPFNQNHPVTLTVTSQQGCVNSLTQNVFVNLPLAIDFSFKNSCENDSAHFQPIVLAPPNAQVNNWKWKFGDNSTPLITPDLIAAHLYQNSGLYSVTLANYDNHGCWDSITHLITIFPLPEPNFTYDTSFCLDSVHFTNLSLPGNDSIISWFWDFNDTLSLANNTSTLTNPVHQFFSNEEHLYHVSLTVMSLDSCTKTIILPVYHGPCLTGSITMPDTIACSGIAYHFVDATQMGTNVTNPVWNWNFGDPGSGPNNNSALQNPAHIYQNPGQYIITLIVSATVNSIQISDTVTTNLLINPSPTASFVHDSCCFGDYIHLTNTSGILSGQISAWVWTFGIGGPAPVYVQNPQPQLFSSPGIFNTTLSVISDQNCPAGVSHMVKVSPNPVARFTADPDSSCDVPLIVSFSDSSTISSGTISNYHYNFGTGTAVNLMNGNTQYGYTNYGVYTVSLIVTSDQQCTDSIIYSNLIHVNQRPEPDFSYTPEPVPIIDPVAHFENTTIAYANYYCYWNFANLDSISNNCNPDFLFSMPGSYEVILYVIDENQCEASVRHTVNVNADLTVFVPNAFTPDGNGDNDVFGVQGIYLDHTDFLMIIVNRWGETMYESSNPDEPWTGKVRNTDKMAPDGVYAYFIRVKDLSGHRREMKGYVTLVKKD